MAETPENQPTEGTIWEALDKWGAGLTDWQRYILAHTVPIALAGTDLSINQDIKALLFNEDVESTFALWNLKVQHSYLLSKIGTAAHGTRRLDSEAIENLPVLLPSKEHKRCFTTLSECFTQHLSRLREQNVASKEMFASLSQRAFRGEL